MTACLSQSYMDHWMSLCPPPVCRSGLFLVSVCICLSLGLSLSAISIPVSVITDKTAEQKCNWFLSPSLCRYRRCPWIVPLVSFTVSEIRQADRKAYIRQSFWSANKTKLTWLTGYKINNCWLERWNLASCSLHSVAGGVHPPKPVTHFPHFRTSFTKFSRLIFF